jgi:hypothetical protein
MKHSYKLLKVIKSTNIFNIVLVITYLLLIKTVTRKYQFNCIKYHCHKSSTLYQNCMSIRTSCRVFLSFTDTSNVFIILNGTCFILDSRFTLIGNVYDKSLLWSNGNIGICSFSTLTFTSYPVETSSIKKRFKLIFLIYNTTIGLLIKMINILVVLWGGAGWHTCPVCPLVLRQYTHTAIDTATMMTKNTITPIKKPTKGSSLKCLKKKEITVVHTKS